MAHHNYLFTCLFHLFQLSIPGQQKFCPIHLFVTSCCRCYGVPSRSLSGQGSYFSSFWDCCLLWAHSWISFLELHTAEQSCPAQAFTLIQQLVTVNIQRSSLTTSVQDNSEGFPCPQSLCYQPRPPSQLHHSSNSVQLFCLALLSLPHRYYWKPSPQISCIQVSISKSVAQRTKLKDTQTLVQCLVHSRYSINTW